MKPQAGARLMMQTNPLRLALQTAGRRMRRMVGSRDALIVVILALTLLATVPDNRRLASALQIVLPLVALGCAATRGETVALLGRFAVLQAGVKGSTHLLGEGGISRRPDGGNRGFPSDHTAVATFGALQMVKQCFLTQPVTKAASFAAAAVTGGSGIEAGRHSLWQVMAGAVRGWATACMPLAGLRGAGRWMHRVWRRHA